MLTSLLTGEREIEASVTLQAPLAFAPVMSPPRQPQEAVIATFGSGHGWSSNGTGTFDLNDTSQPGVLDLNQHVSIVTDTVAGDARVRVLSGLGLDLTDRYLRLYIECDDVTKLGQIRVYGGSANFVDFWQVRVAIPPTVSIPAAMGQLISGQWACLTFALNDTDVAATGAPDISVVDALQVTAVGRSGQAATVRLGGITSIPKPTTPYPNGVVTFTFDDGWLTQYSLALPVFAARGVRPTLYVIKEALESGGDSMTTAQATILQDRYGWEIAAHATTWTRHNATNGLADLSLSELHNEFQTLKSWLTEQGFRGRDHLALPRGGTSAQVISVANQYFTTTRGALHGDGNGHNGLPPGACSGRHKLTVVALDNTLSLAAMQAHIDRAKIGKAWLIFMGHKLDNAAAGTITAKTSDVADLIDYCAAQSVPVRSVGDVVSILGGQA